MNLALLSGAYPPALDGIGDYTHELARHLAPHHDLIIFTAGPPMPAREAWDVVPSFDPRQPRSITRLGPLAAARSLDWLVVQYNPFSFGPRGFNPWLPAVLAGIRRRGRTRIAVMFHETYVPPNRPKFLAMFAFQFPQFFALARVADRIFISTERWAPAVRRAAPRAPLHHLPVGSNIPLFPGRREDARRSLGLAPDDVILGVFGSAHISRLPAWIGEAARTISEKNPRCVLLTVGNTGPELREACAGVRALECGPLEGPEVARHLAAMDVLLAPFTDGLSTRRGSVVAALQQGLPVVSTRTRWTDRLLLDREDAGIFLSPVAEGPAAFVKAAERAMASRATAREPSLFQEHFAWPVIAHRLIEGLAA